MESYGPLPFNLDFYTEATDLSHLVDAMGSDRFSQRYRKLSAGLCEVRLSFLKLIYKSCPQPSRGVNGNCALIG